MSESSTTNLTFITSCRGGEDGSIHAYQLDADAAQLHPLNSTIDVENPFFIALSPDRTFLYAIHEPGEFGSGDRGHVAAYRIEDDRGSLSLLNRQPTRGSAACYVTVDATGQTVLAANYQNGTVISFPVQEDGSLGAATSFSEHAGSSINPERQKEPHAHCFVISPDNQHAYVADLGIDQIVNYRLDAATATLSSNHQPFVRTYPGAGPRHLTFHPQQPFAYVINELGNSVTMFAYNSDSGILLEQQTISTLPDGFTGTSHCADLKITPDGRFLYGTNRGHDSIAAYAIANDGRLTLIGIEPSGAEQPQNLAISPNGSLLLCANMAGGNVSPFRIHKQTGEISSVGAPVPVTEPSCIMIV